MEERGEGEGRRRGEEERGGGEEGGEEGRSHTTKVAKTNNNKNFSLTYTLPWLILKGGT